MAIPEKSNFDFDFNLGEKEFRRLSTFIMSQFGIKLPPNKKTLLQCRLQKRLRALHHTSFKEYVDFVFSAEGSKVEISNMIDAISTNKTDFFREPVHFNFLMKEGIKIYLETSGKKNLSIWSAGCSSGEEPYSIAMMMNEYSSSNGFVEYKILATDISNSVLEHARVGIYNSDKIKEMPDDYKRKYLLKGKNKYLNKVRICSELRNNIEFRKYNLLSSDYLIFGSFDIIFCRNVLIYFERDIQFRILKQLCSVLKKGGYLFLGHSESITGFPLPLHHILPTIFTKTVNH
jgi:chemotaxis protein methyltransferase CheR